MCLINFYWFAYTNKSSPTLNCRDCGAIKIRFTKEITFFVY